MYCLAGDGSKRPVGTPLRSSDANRPDSIGQLADLFEKPLVGSEGRILDRPLNEDDDEMGGPAIRFAPEDPAHPLDHLPAAAACGVLFIRYIEFVRARVRVCVGTGAREPRIVGTGRQRHRACPPRGRPKEA